MKKVIFICKGNMHRSPIAAAFYNLLKKDDSFSESYGTWVDKEGRTGFKLSSYPSIVPFINELKKYGPDISNHVCMQVTPEVLKWAYKIIVIAEEYSIPDWLRKYKYEHWGIVDDAPDGIPKDVENIKSKVVDLLKN